MATVFKIRDGMFLITWVTGKSFKTSVNIEQIIPHHDCNLFYKIEEDKYILQLEIQDISELSARSVDIDNVWAKWNGTQHQMEKQSTITGKENWYSSWEGPKLSKCVLYKNWSITTESSFEIVIQLHSFSVDLNQTIKRLENVHEAIKQIRENPTFADVKFICQNQTITGNSAILSVGSPVLADMFQRDVEDKQQMVIRITDIKADELRQLVQYLYIQDVDFQKVDVSKLFVAADKYGMETLKEKCAIHLTQNLTLENVARCLVLAHLHQTSSLFESSLDFMASNSKAMCSRDVEWMGIIKNHPELALLATKRMAKD